ncbi:MAG: VIT domain-containing protein, partial [Pleurocapsa sp.]
MVKSTKEDSVSSNKNTSYCFNRDCSQPHNDRDAQTCHTCGTNLLLQNRYRALQLIGQGGFGRTFKGIDESQHNQPYYAIKQFWIEPNNLDKAKAAKLFEQEAERLEVLGKHTNIPALQNYFIAGQEQYLVQEFISGDNLAKEKICDEQKIRQLLCNLLPLIQFVHSHKVIHRDIKPENIIRRHQDSSLVLVDFGAAKVVTEATVDKTGTVIGSAAYTAPEQLKGKAVFASDIYSLGVTCVYLLTQIHPFNLFESGENTWNWRHYLSQPVSKELGNVLDKMLEGGINQRYDSTWEILQDLQGITIKTTHTGKKLIGVSAAVVLALLGVRALVSPFVQQVSTPRVLPPTVQNPSPQSINTPRIDSKPGGLYGYLDGKQAQPFALEHTSVEAKIAGNLSRVEVTQTFANPNDKPLEAIYKFPLPDDAAVDDMEIRIGDRIIRGLIKKKEEAKAIYQQAKKEGKTAGLLEQQKDNVFTQSLANIQPGEKVEVVIRYTNTLQFSGSDYEFAFPLVVAPRYEGEQT